MKKKYKVTYICYKDGFGWEAEKIVNATSILMAINKVEEDLNYNYMGCEVISVTKMEE